MNLHLQGKRALVTGSTAGLGEAIVVFLASEGAAVVVHGRNETRAEAVADTIRSSGGTADVVLGDLTAPDGRRYESRKRLWPAVRSTSWSTTPGSTHIGHGATPPRTTGSTATASTWWPAYFSCKHSFRKCGSGGGDGSSRSAEAWPSSPWKRIPTTGRRSRLATIWPSRWPGS